MKRVRIYITSLLIVAVFTISLAQSAAAMDLRTGNLSIDYIKMQQLSDPTVGEEGSNSIVFNGLLSEESQKRSDEIIQVQERLKELGYFDGEADGEYGETTKAAVKKFQKDNGLFEDGMVGLYTMNALNGVENVSAAEIATYINDMLGRDLLKAFLYASQYPYEVHDADDVDHADLPEVCFEHLISSHEADCYCMAATFYLLVLDLGLDAHMVMGEVPLNDNLNNMAAHCWIEVDYPEGVRCYDPQSFNQRGHSGYAFEYGDKNTWKYMNYERIN